MAVSSQLALKELARRELERRRGGETTPNGPLSIHRPGDFFRAAADLPKHLLGVAENLLQIGSSALTTPVAGLEGIVRGLIPGGLDASEAVENRLQAGTYQPRTESGQAISDTLGNFVGSGEVLLDDQLLNSANDNAAPAAALKALFLGLPAAVGVKGLRATPKKAASKATENTRPVGPPVS